MTLQWHCNALQWHCNDIALQLCFSYWHAWIYVHDIYIYIYVWINFLLVLEAGQNFLYWLSIFGNVLFVPIVNIYFYLHINIYQLYIIIYISNTYTYPSNKQVIYLFIQKSKKLPRTPNISNALASLAESNLKKIDRSKFIKSNWLYQI